MPVRRRLDDDIVRAEFGAMCSAFDASVARLETSAQLVALIEQFAAHVAVISHLHAMARVIIAPLS